MLHRAKKTSVNLAKKHRNLILYGFIGLSGVAIDFIIFTILIKFGVPAVIASVISVSAGIVNNFIWNSHYNFKRTDHIWWRFISFYAVGATGVVLSAIAIIVLHDIIGMDSLIAKLISVPFIVAFQYMFNKKSSLAENYKSIPWRQLSIFATCLLVVVIFIFNAPYFNFADEADNLLGGQFIAQGSGALYLDYFSHHMPLAYFISAPLFILLGNKIIAIKVVFAILMSAWLLMMSRHLIKRANIKTFAAFTLLVSITQMLSWSHMLLAETITAYSMTHALILLITYKYRQVKPIKELATFAILGCIPIMSSLSYAPLSALIYMIGLVIYIKSQKTKKLSRLIYFCAISSIPYILLLAYLALNHAFHEFIFQSINFNTLYYSQFTPSAPTSSIDGLFTIVQGSIGGIKNALLPGTGLEFELLPFVFTISTIFSVAYLFIKKRYIIGLFFTSVLFFGSSRYGFGLVLSDGGGARSGTIILLVGLLLFCFVLYLQSLEKVTTSRSMVVRTVPYVLIITIFIISLSSIVKMADTGREYLKKQNTVQPMDYSGSYANMINLINRPNDTYWVGPLDFSSQLIIKTKNASSLRFYLPWQAACPSCQEKLLTDITNNKPTAIGFYKDADVWGNKAYNYASSLLTLLDKSYYKINDQRLKDFYFLKTDSDRINSILSKEGYKI